jgi:hypothetical protein
MIRRKYDAGSAFAPVSSPKMVGPGGVCLRGRHGYPGDEDLPSGTRYIRQKDS